MPTRLKFPPGSTAYLLLAWKRDGAQLDLTGATLAAALLEGPAAPADSALALTTGDDPSLSITWRDDPAGLAILKFSPAATAALAAGRPYFWRASATLANGDVIIAETHQGPVFMSPYLGNPLDEAWGESPPVDGVTQTLLAGGTVTLLPPAMANYVLNRYDLTGLTGGAATDLDALSSATLALLQNGAKLCLSFAGDIELFYKLTAKGADVENAPWIIVCDHDAARVWRLISVSKQGQPCAYNETSQKFHRVWGVGADGAATASLDVDGFAIPA